MAEIKVCGSGEMEEGAVRLVQADRFEIGVIRKNGRYYAYQNYCPHQGGPACEGVMMPCVKDVIDEKGIFLGQTFDEDDMHIVCPWHGYEFHLENGCHVIDEKVRLKKFEVVEREGEVYVSL